MIKSWRHRGLRLFYETERFYSVKVSGNWRVIFSFQGKDAYLVDYIDYH